MENLMFISWMCGIVLSMFLMGISLIINHKQTFVTSVYFFIMMLLTGYITFIPVVAAIICIAIWERFNK